jgi:hypothetical protein
MADLDRRRFNRPLFLSLTFDCFAVDNLRAPGDSPFEPGGKVIAVKGRDHGQSRTADSVLVRPALMRLRISLPVLKMGIAFSAIGSMAPVRG